MDLSLLHKKLLLNWSAGTVSKSISTPLSLNSIQHGFDKLESKIKMRVLMSLLNFDPKTKADCIAPIKELIRLAADDTKSGKVCNGFIYSRNMLFEFLLNLNRAPICLC